MGIKEAARSVLEPYVGAMVADTCVRATALSLGKTSDDLAPSDLPAMTASIKKLLAPIAPPAAIQQVVDALDRAMMVEV